MYAHTHTRTHTHRHTSTHTLACGQNKLADLYRFRSGIRIPEVPLPKSRGERSISTALGAQTIFQGHPLEAMTNGQRKTNEIK